MSLLDRRTFLQSALLAAGPLGANGQPYAAGRDKQLFIDDLLIQTKQGVTLTLNPPLKTGEHNLAADKAWEAFYAGGWNTIIEENGSYRLWYEASSFDVAGKHQQNLGYATSSDGIRWEKPVLGKIEFAGSRQNNLVLTGTVGTVFEDPTGFANARYKFAARKEGLSLYGSSDGIDWKPVFDRPLLKKGQFDTQNQIFWDRRIRKYVAYMRRWEPLRKVGRSETADLASWPEPSIVFSYDSRDPVESDHYNSCVIQYPYAPNVYLMFPSAYYHFPGRKNDGPLDIQFASSRDGIRWDRRFRQPYVRLGLEGAFDGGSIYMSIGMIRKQSELWMYYTGYDFTHGAYSPEKTRYKGVVSRIVQRLDGFVSADAAYQGGELTTVPLTFQGSRLELNIDTGALGEARVELLDAAGRTIPGFSRDAAVPVIGNSVARRVRWNGDPALGELAGKPVSLRFHLRAAKLYAFQFV